MESVKLYLRAYVMCQNRNLTRCYFWQWRRYRHFIWLLL